jgi:hypothetical protein
VYRIQSSEINPQAIDINDNKCLEIDKIADGWLHNKEGQKRTFSEGSTRKLQKYRCTERNRHTQMLGEEKERFLQKKRDAARNRYWRMSLEERTKILQMKGDANRKRYW